MTASQNIAEWQFARWVSWGEYLIVSVLGFALFFIVVTGLRETFYPRGIPPTTDFGSYDPDVYATATEGDLIAFLEECQGRRLTSNEKQRELAIRTYVISHPMPSELVIDLFFGIGIAVSIVTVSQAFRAYRRLQWREKIARRYCK
jgi:hypothetical protein